MERDEGLELLLPRRALLIDQVLIHGIELSLQIIDFFLLIVELLGLLQYPLVLLLHLLELIDSLIIHLFKLVFILAIDLVLHRQHILIIQRHHMLLRRLGLPRVATCMLGPGRLVDDG